MFTIRPRAGPASLEHLVELVLQLFAHLRGLLLGLLRSLLRLLACLVCLAALRIRFFLLPAGALSAFLSFTLSGFGLCLLRSRLGSLFLRLLGGQFGVFACLTLRCIILLLDLANGDDACVFRRLYCFTSIGDFLLAVTFVLVHALRVF